jgi:hypothetical protein
MPKVASTRRICLLHHHGTEWRRLHSDPAAEDKTSGQWNAAVSAGASRSHRASPKKPELTTWGYLVSMKAPCIVTELDWYHYEMCLNLAVNLRFGNEIPSVATLPDVLVHRLYRRWWAQTYFEQLVGQSIRSFVIKKLNKNGTEVRRKTARRGKQPNSPALAGEQEPTGSLQEPPGAERRQSLGELFGPVWTEETDDAGAIVVEYSIKTFTRVHALFCSISYFSDVASSTQLRTIDTRKMAALCAYGEPLRDKDDVMSLVAAIILFLPEHARKLLCDDFLPDFQSTCKIKRLDGSLVDPINLEYLRPAGTH